MFRSNKADGEIKKRERSYYKCLYLLPFSQSWNTVIVPPPSISFTTAADLVKKSDEKAPVIRATPASSPAGTKT